MDIRDSEVIVNRHDVIPSIIRILKEEFPIVLDLDLTPQTPLFSSGLLDSFATVTLLARLETEFNLSVDTNALDIMLFETPESISRIILDRQYH